MTKGPLQRPVMDIALDVATLVLVISGRSPKRIRKRVDEVLAQGAELRAKLESAARDAGYDMSDVDTEEEGG